MRKTDLRFVIVVRNFKTNCSICPFAFVFNKIKFALSCKPYTFLLDITSINFCVDTWIIFYGWL